MILKILNKKTETKNTFSLILEKPDNFNFYPGQFLDIELPVNDPLGKTRIFSIASSPGEDFIMLTCKEGPSEFKKMFKELKKGDTISSSHPAGTVVIDDSSPIVLLSGGIGIAPHRSMIKWAVDRKLNLPITLIYSNSDPDFIFKKELDEWQKQLPNLKVFYHISGKNGHLNREKIKLYLFEPERPQSRRPIPYTLSPIFYLAGPPKMVDDFEDVLLKMGVDEVNIRTDRFDGY